MGVFEECVSGERGGVFGAGCEAAEGGGGGRLGLRIESSRVESLVCSFAARVLDVSPGKAPIERRDIEVGELLLFAAGTLCQSLAPCLSRFV